MSVIRKDLGIATAYGYAVSKGYTGTEEEFAELMASYATVAEEAQEAAEQATQAVQTAQAAANSATTKAGEAATSASGAVTSASQAGQSATAAAGSASTASAKAAEAGTSATNAAASETAATQAAQTATTKAGEASASATAASQSATAAAGSASDASDDADRAETAAGSVSAAAEQIAPNTADIADLKADLNAVQNAVGFYENYWNPSDVVTDHYYANGSSVENASNNYIIIPCKEGDTFYFGNNGESVTARFVNTLTNGLANLQTFEKVSYFTVSDTSAKKIAITFNKSNTKAQINKGSLLPYAHYGKTTLEDSINQLSAKYDSIYKYVDITDLNPNGVYNDSTVGRTISALPTTKSDNYASQIISVKAGDSFRITGKGAASYRLWAFTDTSRKILSNAVGGVTESNLVITAAVDGFLYFQTAVASAYKLEKYCISTERKQIIIVPTDSIQEFYDKFVDAYTSWNCDVYIRNGTYTFTNAFLESLVGDSVAGVPIGHGCRYFFDPSTHVICEYTGENTSVYLLNVFDSQNIGGDFEIYGLNLTAKNVKYAIHDECNSSVESSKHVYKNCKIVLDNTAIGTLSSNLAKCIGGGLGAYEEVSIDNCEFSTVNLNSEYLGADVSYHDPANGSVCDSVIYVTASYFENTLRTASYNNITGQKCRVNVCGCSFGLANSYGANHVVKAWNNEVR